MRRWSFGPNSAFGSIETTTIGNFHPILPWLVKVSKDLPLWRISFLLLIIGNIFFKISQKLIQEFGNFGTVEKNIDQWEAVCLAMVARTMVDRTKKSGQHTKLPGTDFLQKLKNPKKLNRVRAKWVTMKNRFVIKQNESLTLNLQSKREKWIYKESLRKRFISEVQW